MAKIAVTPSIVLAEFILFSKTISYKKVTVLNFSSLKKSLNEFFLKIQIVE